MNRFSYKKRIALLNAFGNKQIDFMLYKSMNSFKSTNESIENDIAGMDINTLTINVGATSLDCAIILLRNVEESLEYADVAFNKKDHESDVKFDIYPGETYSVYYIARGVTVDGFYDSGATIIGDDDHTIDLELSGDTVDSWYEYAGDYSGTTLEWANSDTITIPDYTYNVTTTSITHTTQVITDVVSVQMTDSAADSVLQMINTFNVNIGDILQIGDEQVGVLNIIDEGETGYREYGISRGWDGTLVSDHDVGTPVSVVSDININTGTWRAQHLIGFSNGTNITTSLTGGTIHGSQNHPYISHADRNANYTQSYSGYIRLDPGTHMFGIATDDTGEFKIFEHGDSNDTLVHCWISGNGGIDVNNPSANIPDVMYHI